jgi:hypothetical protein
VRTSIIAVLSLALLSSNSAMASCPIHGKQLCRPEQSGQPISFPRFIGNARDGAVINNNHDGYLIRNTGDGVTINNVGNHVLIDNSGKGVQIYNTGDGVRVLAHGAEITSTSSITSKGRAK